MTVESPKSPKSLPFAPLVEPAAELTRDELVRYARHLTLEHIGHEGQRRLKNARVLVTGAGGLGSPALHYLAAAGVGTIGIVDDDVVDVSNLQRQVVHGVSDIGRAKVESAADAVARINPLVTVEQHHTRLTADNAVNIVGAYDLVMDGADNFATRYVVSDACTLTDTPCVWGSILRFDGRLSVFANGPGHDGISYRDLHPDAPAPGEVPSCAAGGVVGALPGTIGSLMVTEAIKLINGTGSPLFGRLLIHDGMAMTFRELTILPDPDAPLVTAVNDGVGDACAVATGAGAYPTVSPEELQSRLDTGAVLVDVREPWEREIVSIPGALAVPLAELQDRGAEALPDATRGRDVVFHCKAGSRSEQALDAVASYFGTREENAAHLAGGVLAWVHNLHPDLPTY
ncbi:MAG: molybdopterin-synthase adenylyltransferase MoeB [Corynebacterium sp.]|uniref:molybdopterin-synthase adenylyltransferase MoeB n=1 Tax=Corynebacterium TaxID=1716 RepID=UPI002648C595|nr:molybdopterin-synthase adenylyltransferase MoeB [Corynebacterium sp.]MDN6283291.1 molybdopterin-synthase adenylyltransferase MoeB [Corynebacterium sp.]MDN6304344.1 molybdopterin-synthase adenylyltransferase MoeB [Corynebacterium sp.]MDN6367230.1 molybdopterin-synthase adenylyltransferase MoeB [Corynebacterium sp.]MDN6376705.1 molybdopterin-synthase adenylyltransferase MoeB [Corynebacterium sp.]MDN6394677.1 molybdopterin-synthase adenylyltransferase MoeB [Corynebacterium sp.]